MACTGEGNHYFNGVIDEPRLYNRALSKAEIGQLYRTTQPVRGRVDGFNKVSVVCHNNTTGENVTLPSRSRTWNCEAAGLVINPQDNVTITIDGDAH